MQTHYLGRESTSTPYAMLLGQIAELRSSSTMPNYVVQTGNALIDQLRPSFFATAFPFVFKYGTGMPDFGKEQTASTAQEPPSTQELHVGGELANAGQGLAGVAQGPRFSGVSGGNSADSVRGSEGNLAASLADDVEKRGSGRPQDAPLVELKPWCKAVSRRVESHCGRDWLLGFVMSCLCFRTTVNRTRSFHLSTRNLGN